MKLSRRSLIGTGVAAPLVGAVAAKAATRPMEKKTFVLVHGAWHGGWCWRFVADRLTAQGHRVFTPTLTGLGERAHLLSQSVNLDTHISDVLGVLKWEQLENVVLVGHSYAGMVIGGVADVNPERIGALVFLDAFVPEDGKSMSDLAPVKGVGQGPKPLAMPPVPSAMFGVPKAHQAWVDALCTPMPTAAFDQPVHLSGKYLSIKRKMFIRSTPAMPMFAGLYTRLQADPSWKTAVVDCGHDVMIAKPVELTHHLLSV